MKNKNLETINALLKILNKILKNHDYILISKKEMDDIIIKKPGARCTKQLGFVINMDNTENK